MKQSRPDTMTNPAKTVSRPLRATAVPEKKIFHPTRIPMRRKRVPKYCELLDDHAWWRVRGARGGSSGG
jgi:hypothetical protein